MMDLSLLSIRNYQRILRILWGIAGRKLEGLLQVLKIWEPGAIFILMARQEFQDRPLPYGAFQRPRQIECVNIQHALGPKQEPGKHRPAFHATPE